MPDRDVIAHRFAAVMTRVYAADGFLQSTASTIPAATDRAHLVKVHCTDMLESIIEDAVRLIRNAGPSNSRRLDHLMADAVSIELVGAPNHVLLERIGEKALSKLGSRIPETDRGDAP